MLQTKVLGPRHLPLLLMLSVEGDSTVGELATRVGLAPATTSMLANELNRAGFLERREDDDDRRRTILRVPDRHRAVIEDHARQRIAPLQRALDRLGPSRSDQLLAALCILADELVAETSADGPEDCSVVQPTSEISRL
jgi:DNA-binding MarR family transcriptional regulator